MTARFEAADDLLLGLSFLGSAGHVLLGGLVPTQSVDDDQIDRAVGVPVAAAVQAMAGGGFRCWPGSGATPHSRASDASDFSRSMFCPAVVSICPAASVQLR